MLLCQNMHEHLNFRLLGTLFTDSKMEICTWQAAGNIVMDVEAMLLIQPPCCIVVAVDMSVQPFGHHLLRCCVHCCLDQHTADALSPELLMYCYIDQKCAPRVVLRGTC
jgi:hypothetical protein